VNRSDLAARLLVSFIGEMQEQVRVMNGELLALEASPGHPEHVHSLFRIAHTLKGAARAAGVPLIEQMCHELEELLSKARDGTRSLGRSDFEILYAAADALADAAERLQTRRDLGDAPAARVLASLRGELQAAPVAAPSKEPVTPAAARPPGDGQLRVQSEKIDDLLAAGTELLVTGGRMSLRAAEVEALNEAVAQCAARWRHDGRQLRLLVQRAGGGAVEARILGLGDDLERLRRQAEYVAARTRADARAVLSSLHEVLNRARGIRMRPFSEACEGLPRAVRDLAEAAGKDVAFRLEGGEVEADRLVLDGLREALLQLVRNAVDHGMETPERRLAAGKDRRGTVRVAAELKGDRLLVTVSDDGAGFDAEAIRAGLMRRGTTPPEAARDLIDAMLAVRLSTRTEATSVSGRGVGLDIVRAACARLGGRMDVTWQGGRGTDFVIDCPVTLASVRALLVSLGSHAVALPLMAIDRAMRVAYRDLKLLEGRTMVSTQEGPVPVVSLGRLLEPLGGGPATADVVPLVLLRDGRRRLAVAVDELLDVRDLAVRPLPASAAELPAIRSTALLASGNVVLVADPAALVAAGLRPDIGTGVTRAEPRSAAPARRRVLVVDDSLTTRTLERSILEAAGYEVLTAVDGSDGWRVLQEQGSDLVVADVEMPRMDGFALCEAIRASRRFAQLPFVLVTALERPEDRARGLEAGADAYIGKSSFDQESLLETIEQLLGEGGAVS
jgi:two-component system chemotaxis sensor kinase CheA